MALCGGAGALLGAVLVVTLRGDPELAPPGPRISARAAAPSADAALHELREQLAAQQTLGRALQAEVAQLRSRVQELGERMGDAGELDRDEPSVEAGQNEPPPWFDSTQLLDLGVAPVDVARVRERFDSHQLDILYLRDQAAREGWHNKPRFANELRGLRIELAEELGEEDTDLLLWASGQNNRVMLSSLLGGSPALEAGLQNGDVVLAYDGRMILRPRELQRATRAGEAGQQIALDVLRDGEELRFYLPRGPLGTQLQPTRRPPRPR